VSGEGSLLSAPERRDAILAILAARESVRIGELRERIGVSEVTIRKDLTVLEERGHLRRTHGGAVSVERRETGRLLPARRLANTEAKRAIAARAAALISHGETVYLDSGTTCAFLAEEIRHMDLRVVTNSLDVLNVLAEERSISLFMVGGSYRIGAGSFIGSWATGNLASVQLDHAFIGATDVALDGRCASQNSVEGEVKAAAIRNARRATILADRSKINAGAFSIFAGPGDYQMLITDADAPTRSALEQTGIHVIGVDEHGN